MALHVSSLLHFDSVRPVTLFKESARIRTQNVLGRLWSALSHGYHMPILYGGYTYGVRSNSFRFVGFFLLGKLSNALQSLLGPNTCDMGKCGGQTLLYLPVDRLGI